MDKAPLPSSSSDQRSWWGLALLLAVIWGGSTLIQLGRNEGQGEAVRQAQPEGRITLYTTQTCSYCAAAKRWLATERVPYTECLVDTDAACAERFRRMGEPGVPVVQVDEDQFRLGFDADWLAKALARPEQASR
jgi:glutaredoxin